MANQDLATTGTGAMPALSEEALAKLQEKASGITNRIGAGGSAKQIKGDPTNGTITFGDSALEVVPIVVIDFITKRTYYDTPWRKGDPYRPPMCYGIATNPDTMVPHENVEKIGGEKQNDECKSCPLNQWGSDGPGKACKERRVMRVLQPGDEFADEDMWELDISVSSLKSFDKTVRSIADAWNVPPIGAVIELSLDTSVQYTKYEFNNPTGNQAIEAHMARMDEASKDLANLSFDAASEEEEAPTTRPVRKKAARKSAKP